MFVSIIPSMTYIMPAIAGVIVWTVQAQINGRWAVLSYASAALLSLLLVPEMEAKTFFILLFGYYPLLREAINKSVSFKPARFVIKLGVFNAAAVLSYTLVVHLFGIGDVLDGLEGFGVYAVYVFWGMGNIAFFFYDFALTYIQYAFEHWIKPALNRKIRR